MASITEVIEEPKVTISPAVTNALFTEAKAVTEIYDSGASRHLLSYQENFISYKQLDPGAWTI